MDLMHFTSNCRSERIPPAAALQRNMQMLQGREKQGNAACSTPSRQLNAGAGRQREVKPGARQPSASADGRQGRGERKNNGEKRRNELKEIKGSGSGDSTTASTHQNPAVSGGRR